MKRETAEQWMLLEQSGELGPARRWLLRRHLAQHPEDGKFMADAERIMRDAKSLAEIPELSAQVRAAIRVAADQRVPTGAALRWQPALALAAVAVLILGGWFLLAPAPVTAPAPQVAVAPVAATTTDADLAWDNGIDNDISELKSLLAKSSDDSDTTDLETIATELIQLEGSEI